MGVSTKTKKKKKYKPSNKEPFMGKKQREYFRKKLEDWKNQILQESRETITNLQQETTQHADIADRWRCRAKGQSRAGRGNRKGCWPGPVEILRPGPVF